MARILFTWELGGGLGHSLYHRPLLEALYAAGHELWFAMRTPEHAEEIFTGIDIHCLQAPQNTHATRQSFETIFSHAHLLHNVIFHSVEDIIKTSKKWQEIFTNIKPDILIADHSPGALFASRGLPFVRAQIGTGFTIPPDDRRPMPNLRSWQTVEIDSLSVDEDALLDCLNNAADKLGIPALPFLADVYKTDKKYLMTFSELDHIRGRSESKYYGINLASYGKTPVWPEAEGQRIFAYLKPFKTLMSLLTTLKRSGLPTLIYYAGKMTAEIKSFECKTLSIIEEPLNISQVAKQCDVAITHAGHATSTEFLLAGCPLLLLPLYLEQYLFSERVQALGAGLAAPLLKPEGMAGKLVLLLTDRRYRTAAKAFASKYQGFDSRQMIANTVEDLASTLKANKANRQAP